MIRVTSLIFLLLLHQVATVVSLSLRLPSVSSFISSLNPYSSINRMDSIQRRCNCECKEDKKSVKLLAIEKTINVPKIKVHDFGKDEEWDIAGKMNNMDLTDGYKHGTKFIMSTATMEHGGYASNMPKESDSGWEVAGKYDMEKSDWNFNDGKVGFEFSFN